MNRTAIVVIALGLGALVWGAGALWHEDEARASDERWPSPMAELTAPEPEFSAAFGVRRIFLDAGHGAEGNTGNRSCFCRDEADFTLALARDTARALAESGRFEVELSRSEGELVPYADRVERAEAWGAEVFVSLHSDVRGDTEPWEPEDGLSCLRSREAPGFAVLWSDDGAEPAPRRALAAALARRMLEAGFVAYDGTEYRAHYEADPDQGGVFVDRHRPDERIFVLWRPAMPSILVETHNALDDREARRWERASTRGAFAAALAAALAEILG